MSHIPRIRTVLGCALLVSPLAVSATGCSTEHPLSAKPYDATGRLAFNVDDESRQVDPSKPLEVTVKGGDDRITDVTATDAAGRFVRGALSEDGTRWRSTSPLAAGVHYTVRVSTENEDGEPGLRSIGFDTVAADKRLRVTFGPDSGTYGVGQPVTAELSKPVKGAEARAVVERGLRVEAHPYVAGRWHWVDSKTLHYRPREYWPANATIDVRSALDGVRIKGSLYGGPAKPLEIRTGDRVEAITDVAAHQLTVKRNGKVLRTIPVSTGKPGYDTRNGIKVVLAKEPSVRMTSASIGSSDFYDLQVSWATRVTWSGEYVHAAPWSVGSQGVANTSHGCTGMNTENAKWFFDTIRLGDIVQVVNSSGDMMTAFDNGFGDWNMSWEEWTKGSSVKAAAAPGGGGPADPARLRPRT
ncbi:L,D-transpeptidase [Streptomyces meridianus]|uniref:Ig-like domain-containing protein n=1 Tax=Streptomyces meridianus TaxID=2938945 RepID=A0ABT0X2G4_9ACTN|nr:Ig-like domain-containing protein [Streptomyces meridianus]MCM2576395.1 Ig-like domain-containing protein [Streptomyces meridianus]